MEIVLVVFTQDASGQRYRTLVNRGTEVQEAFAGNKLQ